VTVPTPLVPAPPLAAPTLLPPPATPAQPAYQPRGDTIVIVLPLQSALYGRAADAVRAGFIAAANAAGSATRVKVIGHGEDGVLDAVASAADSGAALVVGPLTRDDLKTVLAIAPVRPRMLALNQLEDNAPMPEDSYAFGLAVEADASLLAARAYDDGVRSLAAVVSDAPLQRRFATAFLAAWERAGGAPPRQFRFDPNPEVLALLRRELSAKPPDAVLLAVGGEEAALAKSFLPPGPVYATSQIADGLPSPMLRDLEGVRYVEIPWLADPSAPAFARIARPSLSDPVFERLYALGLDAFTLSELLANPIPPQRVEFDGATGHLSLLPSRNFARQGRIMTIHDGQTVASAPAP
jgi:outer membrane PBP1 activator LpoA protein